MKKNIIIFLLIIFSLFNIFSWRYEAQKNTFFYTIDLPDNRTWNLADDSKQWNAFFQDVNKRAYCEVNVYDLSSAKTNEELYLSFVNRFKMKNPENRKNVTYCQYNAVRGSHTFNYNSNNIQIDFVVFKDNYFFYVVMAYAYSQYYDTYKNDLDSIMQSMKIYYDNNVVYGNDETTNNNQNWDNNVVVNKDKDNETKDTSSYSVHIQFDKASETFKFLYADLKKSIDEIDKIGTYNGNYWNGWTYFNIDFSDPDYEFVFWSKFYQEMYNKNYYRVNDMYDYFKSVASNMSGYELATYIMKCIQVIPYERPKAISNKNTGSNILDYFSPNQVAEKNKGDCDTKSLFMVILLRRMGFDAVMYHSAHFSHAMVGINMNATGTYKTVNGKKYYFIESTYPGWRIGDLPPQMNDTSKWRLIPIK